MSINLLCLCPLTESKAAMHENKNVRNVREYSERPWVKDEMNVETINLFLRVVMGSRAKNLVVRCRKQKFIPIAVDQLF